MKREEIDFDTLKAQVDTEQEAYFKERGEYKQYKVGELSMCSECHTHTTKRKNEETGKLEEVHGYTLICLAEEGDKEYIKTDSVGGLATTHDWKEVISVVPV